jgi:hypothetical protein
MHSRSDGIFCSARSAGQNVCVHLRGSAANAKGCALRYLLLCQRLGFTVQVKIQPERRQAQAGIAEGKAKYGKKEKVSQPKT